MNKETKKRIAQLDYMINKYIISFVLLIISFIMFAVLISCLRTRQAIATLEPSDIISKIIAENNIIDEKENAKILDKIIADATLDEADKLIADAGLISDGKYKGFFRKENTKHFDYKPYDNYTKEGNATFYSQGDPGNNLNTSTGTFFDDTKDTCALPDAMLPVVVTVSHVSNGKSINVICNDRGITAKRFALEKTKRVIDLSRASAIKLDKDFKRKGFVKVKIKVNKNLTEIVRTTLIKNIESNNRKLIII